MNCSKANKALQKNNCNIVVTENLNKTPHWGYHNLKIKGKDIESQKVILFNPEPRAWRPLSDYINVGDTITKNEGEAIMYVFKKDSIVEMNLVNICKEEFDWNNSVKIIMRNKE